MGAFQANFSNVTPAAPADYPSVYWQKGLSPTGVNAAGLPIYDVSAYVPVVLGPGPGGTHDEPLTDGNGNIIFAATLTLGGDVIVVLGVPN
jgi:hypothetical protein